MANDSSQKDVGCLFIFHQYAFESQKAHVCAYVSHRNSKTKIDKLNVESDVKKLVGIANNDDDDDNF